MLIKVVMLMGVVTLAAGVATALPSIPQDPPYPSPYPPRPSYPERKRPYSFRYGVKDDYVGADYGQDETSDGNLVTGSYYVALPDGRRQTVKYQADHVVGYVADVEFEGEAQHPIQPYYPPPPPSYRPLYPQPPPPHYAPEHTQREAAEEQEQKEEKSSDDAE